MGNKTITIHSMPGPGGSPAKHYIAAAYALLHTSRRLEESVRFHLRGLFHACNYDHIAGDAMAHQNSDLEIIRKMMELSALLDEAAHDLGEIGTDAMRARDRALDNSD